MAVSETWMTLALTWNPPNMNHMCHEPRIIFSLREMPGHAQDMVGYAGDMAGTHRGSRLETAKYSTT